MYPLSVSITEEQTTIDLNYYLDRIIKNPSFFYINNWLFTKKKIVQI